MLLVMVLLAGAAPAGAVDRVVHRGADGVTVRPVEGGPPSTLAPEGHLDAVWTPDRAAIVYTTEAGVWSVAADGSSAPRLLVADDAAGSLDISPAGRHVAYSHQQTGGSGIMVVATDGGPVRAITAPRGDDVDSDPRWAPDGQTIAFRRFDVELGRHSLHLAAVAFADPMEVTDVRTLLDVETYTTLSAPAWEPDGRHLVVAAVRLAGTGRHQLFRARADGSEVELLIADEAFDTYDPAVSPDGRAVAYGRRCVDCPLNEAQTAQGNGLWLLDLATGAQSLLAATDGEERDPDWTADAGTVVFESYFQDSGCHCDISDLYAMGVDDGAPTRLDTFLPGPVRLAASPGVAVRVSGPSRIETAVAVSRESFATASVVVLARADAYADALAGAPLAGSVGGPLLLTAPDVLSAVVEDEIRRLGTRRVVVLGDETAVAPAVEDRLQELVATGVLDAVERIGGTTRYGTAALVAEGLSSDHAYVVQGAAADPARGWPDAVAVAGLAASESAPLLLTEATRLPPETATAITDGGITSVTVVGGTAAVSAEVEQQLRDLGAVVDRVSGPDRYETSVAVAERARQRGASVQSVWLATGRNWPDTLAAGPAAAHTGAILLLADGADPNGSLGTFVFLEGERVARGWLVGGPDVLSPATAVALERRAGA